MNKTRIAWLIYILILLSINLLYFIEENENEYCYEDVISIITIFYFIFTVIAYSFKYNVGLKITWQACTIAAIIWNLYAFISHLIIADDQYHWIGILILVISFIFIMGPAFYASLRYSYNK